MSWLLACLSSGCVSEEPMPPPLDPAAWRFPTSEERARYDAVRAELAARYPGAQHQPLERLGNFLQERWCPAGTDPAVCRKADREHATLSVLHAPARYPEVFGLVFDAAGREGERFASVHWSEGGKTITGDSLVVRLQSPQGAVELGSTASYPLADSPVQLAREPRALLQQLVGEAPLVETAGALLQELAQAAADKLDSGEARRCVYGPAQAGGVPPECTLTPLDPAQIAEERQKLEGWLASQRGVLQAHGEPLQELLRSLVPPSML
jgi:hypothetical protein